MNVTKAVENMRRIDSDRSLLMALVDLNEKYTCPVCESPLNVRGRLAPGSVISIKCVKCKKCTPFGVATAVVG
jgi:transcription elongation factor Elf1